MSSAIKVGMGESKRVGFLSLKTEEVQKDLQC